jgi:hypothetical protein
VPNIEYGVEPAVIHPLTWLNMVVVCLIVIYSAYYLIWGRTIDRRMMAFNLFAGLFVLVEYGLFLIDTILIDFITRQQVSSYIIKPVILILLLALLANILRIGKRR